MTHGEEEEGGAECASIRRCQKGLKGTIKGLKRCLNRAKTHGEEEEGGEGGAEPLRGERAHRGAAEEQQLRALRTAAQPGCAVQRRRLVL